MTVHTYMLQCIANLGPDLGLIIVVVVVVVVVARPVERPVELSKISEASCYRQSHDMTTPVPWK